MLIPKRKTEALSTADGLLPGPGRNLLGVSERERGMSSTKLALLGYSAPRPPGIASERLLFGGSSDRAAEQDVVPGERGDRPQRARGRTRGDEMYYTPP